MTDEEKQVGVISASLGNHAQGLSYHAYQLGIPCTVVMPVTAPIMKIQKCRSFGAEVLVQVRFISMQHEQQQIIQNSPSQMFLNLESHYTFEIITYEKSINFKYCICIRYQKHN